MKIRWTSILIVTLAATAFAVQQIHEFSDKGGNMVIKGFTSFRTERGANDKVNFLVKGSPVVGSWTKQGIEISGATITGDAKLNSGKMMLETATVSGGMKATHKGADGSSAVVTGQSGKVLVGANEFRFDVLTDAMATITTAKGDTTGNVGGTSVTCYTPAAPVQIAYGGIHGQVLGQVRFSFSRKTASGVVVMRGTAGHADFDFSKPEGNLTLSGGVTLEGNDPVLMGDVKASTAVVTFDKAGQPSSVDLTGDPGVTTASSKGGKR